VEDEADRVINPLIVTKGMVTTLMCNDPNTSENAALDSPIDWPSKVGKRVREDVEVRGSDVVEEEG
jgi:hypothetical protein